jgi:hypothetical protein
LTTPRVELPRTATPMACRHLIHPPGRQEHLRCHIGRRAAVKQASVGEPVDRRVVASAGQTVLRLAPRWSNTPQQQGPLKHDRRQRCLRHHWGRDPGSESRRHLTHADQRRGHRRPLRAPLKHSPWRVAAENRLLHLARFSDTACMQLPRWMVKVIDPPSGYMQDRTPRPAGPIFRGGAIFGPGVGA